MTDELERAERYLMDKPQRLGFLPTWWFWNNPDNYRPARWFFVVFVVALSVILDIVSPGPLTYVVIFMSAFFVFNGLLEKYIRHQAVKRRHELAARVDPSLPPAEDA